MNLSYKVVYYGAPQPNRVLYTLKILKDGQEVGWSCNMNQVEIAPEQMDHLIACDLVELFQACLTEDMFDAISYDTLFDEIIRTLEYNKEIPLDLIGEVELETSMIHIPRNDACNREDIETNHR